MVTRIWWPTLWALSGVRERPSRLRIFHTVWWLIPILPAISLGPHPVRSRTMATVRSIASGVLLR